MVSACRGGAAKAFGDRCWKWRVRLGLHTGSWRAVFGLTIWGPEWTQLPKKTSSDYASRNWHSEPADQCFWDLDAD